MVRAEGHPTSMQLTLPSNNSLPNPFPNSLANPLPNHIIHRRTCLKDSTYDKHSADNSTSSVTNSLTNSLDLSQPHVMGILNVTPDSFSDGGQFNSVENAVKQAQTMLDEGVSIIDIGGESTRPNAQPVSTQQELERVIPVIQAIRQQLSQSVWLSLDTSNPEVMQQGIQAGADIINDVRALTREGALQTVAKLQVPVVLMHMRGEPTTMHTLAEYDNVVDNVVNELKQRVEAALHADIAVNQIIIDPGFGFAKNHQHHLQLLTQFEQLHQLNLPILFGVSRKRFTAEILNNSGVAAFVEHKVTARDPVSMAMALIAVQQGASIIRTHNVGMTKQALTLWQQLQQF